MSGVLVLDEPDGVAHAWSMSASVIPCLRAESRISTRQGYLDNPTIRQGHLDIRICRAVRGWPFGWPPREHDRPERRTDGSGGRAGDGLVGDIAWGEAGSTWDDSEGHWLGPLRSGVGEVR